MKTTYHIGIDLHAKTAAIAWASSCGKLEYHGSCSATIKSTERTLLKLAKSFGVPFKELRVCYEAGPTGFVLARRLSGLGVQVTVVAPSLIPRRPGERIKTDKHDALQLARLHRAGEFKPIHIPDAQDEMVRDLCRARTDAVEDMRRIKQQLSEVWMLVRRLLRKKFSPMQIAGVLRRFGILSISHETIYQHVLEDRRRGGALYKNLRGAARKRRKRYGRYDSRGRLAGKRPITDRPPGAENRSRIGHWEIATVVGPGRACILTLVERKTGYVQIAKLDARTKEGVWKAMNRLISRNPTRYKIITADNGCEFHGYRRIEDAFGLRFHFAKPYHSWERGTNENANGLIRQYIPKRTSMANITQHHCDWISDELNNRPRERHGFYTPEELFLPASNVALHS